MNVLPLTAVYDANVLYRAFLRDVLLHVAEADLVRGRWTARIHDEWMRNLAANRPDIASRVEGIRRAMDDAILDALVVDYEDLINELSLPDADDRHVLAAAIRAEAQVIVTLNVNDFPAGSLQPHRIEAQTPDEFLQALLGADADRVCLALSAHRAAFKNPPLSPAEYLDHMRRNHLAIAADQLVTTGCLP